MHGWRVNRPQMGVVINIMCSPLWRGPIFTRCLPYGPPFEVYHSTITSILQRAALLNTAAEHLKHYAHHGSQVCLLNSTSLQSGKWEGLFRTQATHAVLLLIHSPWFVDCASKDEVCCPRGGCSHRQGKDSMRLSKSDGWKYGIKSENVIFYPRKIFGSGRVIESQEFNVLQWMEAWSERVKSRSSQEWIWIVGMAMSKTKASEPWAAGKVFTYRSSLE